MAEEELENIVDDFIKDYDLWNKEGFVGCGIGLGPKENQDPNVLYLEIYWLKDKELIELPAEYKGLKTHIMRSGGIIPH